MKLIYNFFPLNSLGITADNHIDLLLEDGWYVARKKGSHRQFKHNVKKGTVTVNGKPNEVLDQFLLNSIWKQAGWR
ncbi:type II toxin-antitoxin system HicA family toxin [Proteiniphilum saccharofermentans]|uniref:type II toxin-antitoxin system HicA family toxin n=2 Tax=Proteiniphilum saccharofermentans TaxID=1642647 RepID=UPI0029374014|nr:type II toxin-antitoxin system HicA family toxin [Proteiniphilum saccharofermentans]